MIPPSPTAVFLILHIVLSVLWAFGTKDAIQRLPREFLFVFSSIYQKERRAAEGLAARLARGFCCFMWPDGVSLHYRLVLLFLRHFAGISAQIS
jgi:hypothetical protein